MGRRGLCDAGPGDEPAARDDASCAGWLRRRARACQSTGGPDRARARDPGAGCRRPEQQGDWPAVAPDGEDRQAPHDEYSAEAPGAQSGRGSAARATHGPPHPESFLKNEDYVNLIGIHHLTAVSARATATNRFYTQTLGMHLVKR